MQSRASRVVRGWIAGSFAAIVAVVSHSLAAGAGPSTFAILNALVFAGVLGTFTVGRRPSLPRLGVLVVGSQFAFHLVFVWLTPGSVSGNAVGGAHHSVGALLPFSTTTDQASAAMWLGHALAAVATVFFLRRVELALWNLVREALEAVTRAPLGEPVMLSPASPGIPVGAAPPRDSFRLLSALSRRGPPLSLGA